MILLTRELAAEIAALVREFKNLREQRKEQFDWFREHLRLATKEDLKESERRIIEAIKGGGGELSQDDRRVLNGLLSDSERRVSKLEALDAQTPPVV